MLNWRVNAIALQTDGKIIIGGNFTTIGSAPVNRLARLNADGSLDNTYNASVNDNIYALALQSNGTLVLGGRFTQVMGQAQNYLARLYPPQGGAAGQGLMMNGGAVHWVRMDESPELIAEALLAFSLDGENYVELGTMTRNEFGWELAVSLDFVKEESIYLRASGPTQAGWVEEVRRFTKDETVLFDKAK